jgi:hypothetical protein
LSNVADHPMSRGRSSYSRRARRYGSEKITTGICRTRPTEWSLPTPQSSTRNPSSGAHRAQNRRRQPHQLGSEQMTTLRSSALVAGPRRSLPYCSCCPAYSGDPRVGASEGGDRHA